MAGLSTYSESVVAMCQRIAALVAPARALAPQQVGLWYVVDSEVFMKGAEGEAVSVARCGSPERASYVAACHNAFLPLVNAVARLQSVLADRVAVAALGSARAKAQARS